jgi:hypothetical protein
MGREQTGGFQNQCAQELPLLGGPASTAANAQSKPFDLAGHDPEPTFPREHFLRSAPLSKPE